MSTIGIKYDQESGMYFNDISDRMPYMTGNFLEDAWLVRNQLRIGSSMGCC